MGGFRRPRYGPRGYGRLLIQHIDTKKKQAFFEVLATTDRSQAATMVLASGQSTGGSDNRHPDADQWLYVVAGVGRATVEGETIPLAAGSLLLIEAGEAHEIENAGAKPLRTISMYAPPEY